MNEAFEHAYGKLNENGDFIDSINEADVVIPKDKMFDPDSISLTGIARQAKEAEDARIAKEAEDKRKAEAEIRLKPTLDEVNKASDKLEVLFDKLVPNSGAAQSVAGEMVRAMMRILYRDYNDGDVFYEGYGLETCGSSAEFLMDSEADLADDFKAIAEDQLTDEAYTEAITAISNKLVEFIVNNPYLMIEDSHVDSRDYDIDWLDEHQPKYDYTCNLPEIIVDHINNGDISSDDVRYELEYWEIPGLGGIEKNCDSLYVYHDTVEISGLTKDAYDWVDEHLYNELESYASTLDEEYGSTDYDDEELDDGIDESMKSNDLNESATAEGKIVVTEEPYYVISYDDGEGVHYYSYRGSYDADFRGDRYYDIDRISDDLDDAVIFDTKDEAEEYISTANDYLFDFYKSMDDKDSRYGGGSDFDFKYGSVKDLIDWLGSGMEVVKIGGDKPKVYKVTSNEVTDQNDRPLYIDKDLEDAKGVFLHDIKIDKSMKSIDEDTAWDKVKDIFDQIDDNPKSQINEPLKEPKESEKSTNDTFNRVQDVITKYFK